VTWTVEIARLALTPDKHDSEWIRVNYFGWHMECSAGWPTAPWQRFRLRVVTRAASFEQCSTHASPFHRQPGLARPGPGGVLVAGCHVVQGVASLLPAPGLPALKPTSQERRRAWSASGVLTTGRRDPRWDRVRARQRRRWRRR
jgi:hypothetical protein